MKKLVLLLGLLFAGSLRAVSFTGTAAAGDSGAVEVPSITVAHPLGAGSNRLGMVFVGSIRSGAGNHTISATYNGVAMTNCGGWQTVVTSGAFGAHCLYIKEASLPVAGTYDVVVSSTTNDSLMEAIVVSYANVDQTTPVSGGTITAAISTSSPTITGVSATGDLAAGYVMWKSTNTISVNGGETSRFEDENGSTTIMSGAVSDEAGAASTNLLWALSNSTTWKMGFISIKDSGTATATPTNTYTPSNTPSQSATPTKTFTNTPTVTNTFTPTLTPTVNPNSWYISPIGTKTDKTQCTTGGAPSTNDCTFNYARSGGSNPGETIWFKDGVYNSDPDAFGTTCLRRSGTYTVGGGGPYTGGTQNPVIYRAVPGARVVVRGTSTNQGIPALTLCAADSWVWGLEVTQLNNANRVCPVPGTNCNPVLPDIPIQYGEGISVRQGTDQSVWPLRNKIINCIVHDARQGLSIWAEMPGGEATGNISYYNGWSASDRGHGHAMYLQTMANGVGDSRLYRQNIGHNNASHGMHSFGSSSAHNDNVVYQDNIMFRNSDIPEVGGGGRDFLAGGNSPYVNNSVTGNFLYGSSTGGFQYGWVGMPLNSITNSTITGNYILTPQFVLDHIAIPAGISVGGAGALSNTIIFDSIAGFTTSNYPDNTWSSPRASYAGADFVKYNRNPYDVNRCDITIHNPDSTSTVNVNLATGCGFSTNDSVQIHNVEDLFGTAVNTVYAGGSYAMPMTTATWPNVEDPAGNWTAPSSSLPKMGVFIVNRTAAAGTPTPTASETFTPSKTFTNTPTNTATITPTVGGPTNTPTFTPSRTPTPFPGGCTYIQAEAGTLVAPMAVANDPLAIGGQYITSGTPNAGTATFTFILPNNTYYFFHRVLAPIDTADSFFVSIDGASDATHIDDAAEQSWSPAWQMTRTSDRAIATCPQPGNPALCQFSLVIADNPAPHTLAFRGREVGTQLDEIVICPSTVVPPDVQPTATPTPTFTPTSGGPTNTPVNTNTPTRTSTKTPTPGGVGKAHFHMCYDPVSGKSHRIRHAHAPVDTPSHQHLPYCSSDF